jgi:hypothetical protein
MARDPATDDLVILDDEHLGHAAPMIVAVRVRQGSRAVRNW